MNTYMHFCDHQLQIPALQECAISFYRRIGALLLE